MPEPAWTPTKTTTQNHELEDGHLGDNYPIQMPWIHLLEGLEAGLQDLRKSTITHLHTHRKEDSCKEEEVEEDALDET